MRGHGISGTFELTNRKDMDLGVLHLVPAYGAVDQDLFHGPRLVVSLRTSQTADGRPFNGLVVLENVPGAYLLLYHNKY